MLEFKILECVNRKVLCPAKLQDDIPFEICLVIARWLCWGTLISEK